MVLTVLYPTEPGPHESLQVDIVAVHGLDGDPTGAWTNRKTHAFWVKDFLPLDIPSARVMSFGYNASSAFGNTGAKLIDHAKDLLSSLIDKREEAEEFQRPVIFIAHSLGGIVVKQALIWANNEAQYNNISEKTLGVIFFGTPHRGTQKAAYGKVLANIATTATRRSPPHLISALQAHSDELMRLTAEFKFQVSKYQIISFYEQKPMKMFSSLIVERYSALLEVSGEDQIPVNENHNDMCKFESRDDEVYEKLFKRIRRMLKGKEGPPSGTNYSLNKHYYVPHNVSSVFTGRDNIRRELEKSCLPQGEHDDSGVQKRFVCYGLGGSGKTQVCLKFAQDHRGKFWGIFWVDASSVDAAERGFAEIAFACGHKEGFEASKTRLSNVQDPWLLIIDNADDPSVDISRFFPTGNRGTVLITTRNPDFRIHATVGTSEFRQMEVDEAVTLLLKTTASEDVLDDASRNLAEPVVRMLGYLALAVVQAGATVRQGLCSLEEYCNIYSHRRQQLLRSLPTQARNDYKYTVYTTWEVSVDMIQKMSTEASINAIEILQFFSFLHFDGITEDILKEAWVNTDAGASSEWLMSHQLHLLRHRNRQEWDPYPIREAVALLSSFSLINVDGLNKRISMHPLVHIWARDRLTKEKRNECWAMAISTLAMAIPSGDTTSDRQFRRILIPHIDSCLRFDNGLLLSCEAQQEQWETLSRFAHGYRENGRPQESARLLGNVLEAKKRILGEEHPGTLTSASSLAESYYSSGRYQEAASLCEEVLEARRRILGKEHPDTLVSGNSLASNYYGLGRHQEAANMNQEVLEARRRILGKEHPDTLISGSNLANSYYGLGRYQEAANIDQEVLEARRRILGKEHPDTLVSGSNLANIYHGLGRYQEAANMNQEVLEARRRILGKEHPDTLVSGSNLACSYYGLGRYQEAANIDQEVLEARRRILGKEHPDTLVSGSNLASSYHGLGRYQEAANIDQEVLEARRRILGKEHPATLMSGSSLANSYYGLGRYQEAANMDQEVLEARRRILGKEHPATLVSGSSLANSYYGLGRYQEAVNLGEEVLEAEERILGKDHPGALVSASILAFAYKTQNRVREAIMLQEKAVEAARRTLGDGHPNTLMYIRNLKDLTAEQTAPTQAAGAATKGDNNTPRRMTARHLLRPRSWLKPGRLSPGR